MTTIRIKIRKPRISRFERSEEGIALAEGYVLWQRIAQALGKSDLNSLKRKHGKDIPARQYTSKRVYYSIDAVAEFFKIPGLGEALRIRHKGARKPWILHSKTPGRG